MIRLLKFWRFVQSRRVFILTMTASLGFVLNLSVHLLYIGQLCFYWTERWGDAISRHGNIILYQSSFDVKPTAFSCMLFRYWLLQHLSCVRRRAALQPYHDGWREWWCEWKVKTRGQGRQSDEPYRWVRIPTSNEYHGSYPFIWTP